MNVLKENMKSLLTTTISSDMFKSAIDGLIKFTDGLNKVLQALDKVGAVAPVVFGTIAGLVSGMKGFNSLSSLRLLTTGWTKDMTLMQKATSATKDGMSMLGGAVAKAGGFLKNFLAQGLLIAGVTIAVKALAKAWDYANNSVKNTAKELQEVEDGQLSTIKSHNEKITTLQTVGKEYETLANKAKKTAEEEARMLELGNELARVMPELQIGTDENGNAILSMTTDMEGYIAKTKEAIEQQNRLLLGTRIEQSENALKMDTKGELRGKDKDGNFEQRKKAQEDYNKDMEALQYSYLQRLNGVRTSEGKMQKDALKDLSDIRNQMIKTESEYGNKYAEAQSKIMENAQKHRDTMSSLWQESASYLVTPLSSEQTKNIESLMGSLDFSEIDSQDELNNIQRIFRELPKLAQDGTVNLGTLNTQLKDINSEFARTGNLEDYNLNMKKLAQSVSKETGWDAGVLEEMFTTITNGTLKSQVGLESFLNAFGKTRQELQNGDSIAKGLQAQFVAMDDYLNEMVSSMGNIEAERELVMKLKTDKNLPQQINDLVNNLSDSGVSDTAVITIASQVMMDLGDNGVIDNMDFILQSIDSALQEELGADYTQEMALQVRGYLEKLNSEEILKEIESEVGQSGEVEKSVTVTVDGEGVQKVKDVEEAISILEGRPDVYKEVKAVVDGDEDLILFGEIIKNLPVNETFTNKFIVENKEALSNMKTYQEVVDYINALPDDVKKTYGFNVEGGKETLDTVENINKEVEKDKVVEIKTNNGEVLDSIKDIETLIKLSAEVEKGKYKLEFDANTQEAVSQLQRLKEEVNFLSNQLREVPTTSINIRTEQSAKNLTGLKNRISETKTALESLSSKNVNVNTALSAKNLSGLIVRVQQYSTAIGGVLSRNINVNTALSAKNISGLIRKIQEYNGTKAKTLTFKTNASTIASQIRSLASAVRSVPNGKTIKYSIQTTGSVPKLSTPRMTMGMPNANDIQAQTLGIQAQLRDGLSANPIDLSNTFTGTTPTVSPMLKGKVTPDNAMDYFKLDVNAFKDLETALEKINKQLDLLDKRAKLAFGNDKANLLKRQLSLLEKQQSLQSQMSDDLKVYQNELQYFLSQKGVEFDSGGNVVNEQEKLLSIAKQLDELNKKSGDSKDDSAKKEYDSQKESLENVKKALEEYIDISNGKIPGCTAEWYELQQQINDTKVAILEAKDELRDFNFDNNISNMETGLSRVQREISRLDKEIDRAFGDKKADLIEKKVALLKEEQKQLHNLANEYRKQATDIGKFLNDQGFIIDDSGKIGNYAEQLEKLKDSPIYEYIKEQLDEFVSIINDKIPDAQDKWKDLQYEIEDCSSAIKEAQEEAKNFKIEIDIGKAELAIKKLQREISKLDREIDKAFGKKKEELLNKQIDAMKKEQEKLHQLANTYRKQAQSIGKYLNSLGFNINESDGRIDLDFLESLKGHKDFDFIVAQLEKYIKLTQTDIPGLQDDWWGIQDAIDDAKDAIEEARKELEKFIEQAKVDTLLDQFNDLGHQIDLIDKKLQHATGLEKLDLISKKLELIKQQQVELQKHHEFFTNKKNELQGYLGGLGFTFDADGDISNYVEQLERIANSSDNFEEVKEKLEEYFDIQNDRLPGIESDWLDLENAYKDVLKDQLNTTKQIEDKITAMYKKQVQDRIDAMNKETEAKIKSLKKVKLPRMYRNVHRTQI